MNERAILAQLASLNARLTAIEEKVNRPENRVPSGARILPARLDAIEAAVDQISQETGTGPAPDAEEVKAPSVPRRAKKEPKT